MECDQHEERTLHFPHVLLRFSISSHTMSVSSTIQLAIDTGMSVLPEDLQWASMDLFYVNR